MRGTAYLEMGAPLLAELHFTQPQVDGDLEEVASELERIQVDVQGRQRRTRDEQLELDEAASLSWLAGVPVVDCGSGGDGCVAAAGLLRVAERLKREGTLVFNEGFYASSGLKFELALRFALRAESEANAANAAEVRGGRGGAAAAAADGEGNLEGGRGVAAARALQVACRLALAASALRRKAEYAHAVAHCTKVLLMGAPGLEHPKALLRRSQAPHVRHPIQLRSPQQQTLFFSQNHTQARRCDRVSRRTASLHAKVSDK